MKEIKLTKGKTAIVDDEDYEYLNSFNWQANKYCHSDKYRAMRKTTVGGKKVYLLMHRVILCAKSGQKVDHKDGDGLNNRRSNIRIATTRQNTANRITRNKLGYKGVIKGNNGRYRASIRDHRQKNMKYLGTFDDIEDAARAYDNTAIEIFGEFAYLNFPDSENLA